MYFSIHFLSLPVSQVSLFTGTSNTAYVCCLGSVDIGILSLDRYFTHLEFCVETLNTHVSMFCPIHPSSGLIGWEGFRLPRSILKGLSPQSQARPLTTAVTTGWWSSIRLSWFSLAHSNRVYIMAPPRLASACSSTLETICCFVTEELWRFGRVRNS